MGWMGWVVVLFVLGFVNWGVAALDLRKFLARHDAIKDEASFGLFKAMARKQMYLALVQLALMIGLGVVGCVGIAIRQLGWWEILIFLAFNGVNLALGKGSKSLELKVKSLPTADDAMATAYAEVCARWRKNVFPDF